jgi:hypothetical protein
MTNMADNPWAALQARWEDDAEREAMERHYGEPPAATESDAVREWVGNVGAECPDRAWLCSNYDTWEKNPHYVGPEEPHPEDDDAWEDIAAWRAARAQKAAEDAIERAKVAADIAAFNAMTREERHVRVAAVHAALDADGDSIPF